MECWTQNNSRISKNSLDGKSNAIDKQTDDLQITFPNFMTLTEEERRAFFQTLYSAKLKLEQNGVTVLPQFGTVHDQSWNNVNILETIDEKSTDCGISSDDDVCHPNNKCKSCTLNRGGELFSEKSEKFNLNENIRVGCVSHPELLLEKNKCLENAPRYCIVQSEGKINKVKALLELYKSEDTKQSESKFPSPINHRCCKVKSDELEKEDVMKIKGKNLKVHVTVSSADNERICKAQCSKAIHKTQTKDRLSIVGDKCPGKKLNLTDSRADISKCSFDADRKKTVVEPKCESKYDMDRKCVECEVLDPCLKCASNVSREDKQMQNSICPKISSEADKKKESKCTKKHLSESEVVQSKYKSLPKIEDKGVQKDFISPKVSFEADKKRESKAKHHPPESEVVQSKPKSFTVIDDKGIQKEVTSPKSSSELEKKTSKCRPKVADKEVQKNPNSPKSSPEMERKKMPKTSKCKKKPAAKSEGMEQSVIPTAILTEDKEIQKSLSSPIREAKSTQTMKIESPIIPPQNEKVDRKVGSDADIIDSLEHTSKKEYMKDESEGDVEDEEKEPSKANITEPEHEKELEQEKKLKESTDSNEFKEAPEPKELKKSKDSKTSRVSSKIIRREAGQTALTPAKAEKKKSSTEVLDDPELNELKNLEKEEKDTESRKQSRFRSSLKKGRTRTATKVMSPTDTQRSKALYFQSTKSDQNQPHKEELDTNEVKEVQNQGKDAKESVNKSKSSDLLKQKKGKARHASSANKKKSEKALNKEDENKGKKLKIESPEIVVGDEWEVTSPFKSMDRENQRRISEHTDSRVIIRSKRQERNPEKDSDEEMDEPEPLSKPRVQKENEFKQCESDLKNQKSKREAEEGEEEKSSMQERLEEYLREREASFLRREELNDEECKDDKSISGSQPTTPSSEKKSIGTSTDFEDDDDEDDEICEPPEEEKKISPVITKKREDRAQAFERPFKPELKDDKVKEENTPVHDKVKEKSPPVHDKVREKSPPVYDRVKEKSPPRYDKVKEESAPVDNKAKEESAPVEDKVKQESAPTKDKVKGERAPEDNKVKEEIEQVDIKRKTLEKPSLPPYRPGKVVFVDDNVIEKIRNVIVDLEKKAKGEGDHTMEKEYTVLLVNHLDYLATIMMNMLEEKRLMAKATNSPNVKFDEENLKETETNYKGPVSTTEEDSEPEIESEISHMPEEKKQNKTNFFSKIFNKILKKKKKS